MYFSFDRASVVILSPIFSFPWLAKERVSLSIEDVLQRSLSDLWLDYSPLSAENETPLLPWLNAVNLLKTLELYGLLRLGTPLDFLEIVDCLETLMLVGEGPESLSKLDVEHGLLKTVEFPSALSSLYLRLLHQSLLLLDESLCVPIFVRIHHVFDITPSQCAFPDACIQVQLSKYILSKHGATTHWDFLWHHI